jgi:hypothetical protein
LRDGSARGGNGIYAAVAQPNMDLVIFFCSSEYDLAVLTDEMNRLFSGIQVVGCTTAGEIGPSGCRTRSVSGASFSVGSFVTVSGLLENLHQFNTAEGNEFAQTLLQRLERRDLLDRPDNRFALFLIDGMSMREEPVAHALQAALGKTVICGGSAGDNQKFSKTNVYCDGKFHSDSAVLILIQTPLPFRAFMTHHFVSTDERFVVTEADVERRIVKEINGLPAANEYARLLGVDTRDLGTKHFSASPLVVRIGGTDYVRSIQKANSDGSLTLFCAIDRGVVLRVAHGVDLVSNLEKVFDTITNDIGPPQLVIGCECILRNMEVLQKGLGDRVEKVFLQNNTIGFNSYGEQIHGIHVNQTFTGIAIGRAVESIRELRDV